ncbi:polysaccharide deacetylase family protein [Clostridium vincentii]|uniref:Peptidoglycan-N-acetylglucosamine deacetylase n=1 Tax=Clostridium vincentii TaxID=52704 RepID=A0A2T0BFJ1_9CLOT|nr:polysaccharide deacetylase family protein [Clostridium vincentii]PRR82660.1 Peptidoglycan-N-acetylglucosamine deacetylase [Clostridium vincentii]
MQKTQVIRIKKRRQKTQLIRRKTRRQRKNKGIILKIILMLTIIIGVFFGVFKTGKYFYNKYGQATLVTSGKNTEEINPNDNIENSNEVIAIDENTIKESNVNEDGEKYTYDIEKLKNEMNGTEIKDGKKIVFLTFDDGPSITVTPEILDVLKEQDVKATFFLIGKSLEADEKSKQLVKRAFEEGNALGNHTYTHDLKKVFPGNKINIETYMNEVNETNEAIKRIIGQGFHTRVLRIPGGYMSRKYYNDPNLDAFSARLKENNMYDIDWNAYDQDSEGKKKTADELVEITKASIGAKEKVVILMHDTYGKEQTAKALPRIIKYLKEQGYEFRTLK